MNVQTAAFIVGMVFGGVAVSCASYVWVRHRVFGLGGSVLSIVGIALLGLSIWRGIKIDITQTGVTADFQRLERRVETISDANRVALEEIGKAARTAETGRDQLIALTKAVEPRSAQGTTLETIRKTLMSAPTVDERRLEAARERLGRAAKQ
jgi:hypothetical protein